MASGRILTTFTLSLFLISGLFSACGSTPNLGDLNPVTDQTLDNDRDTTAYGNQSQGDEQGSGQRFIDPSDQSFYEQYQTKLSDLYINKDNPIPEAFLVEKEDEVVEEKDPFQGFRVQIYTGEDVEDADTTAAHFRTWADTTIAGYQADTYIFFKPPNYRIHVGDFHSRDRANAYARLVKRRFRGAWVVYDRVNPWNVPADSVSFTIIQ